jgi:hypothetical protein
VTVDQAQKLVATLLADYPRCSRADETFATYVGLVGPAPGAFVLTADVSTS